MAGITRATAQIFSTTGLTGTGGFGAAAAGTTTTEAGSSNTLANIQTGTAGAWAAGWLSAVLGASKFPAVEDMNAVFNVTTTQIAYILERGIPEYDAGTSYNTGDIARGVGLTTLYKSVGNANIGNALSNATYWTFLCDLSNLAANVFTGGTTTGSANAQTLASVAPATGLTPSNGQTIVCTAGYTNSGAATLTITSPSIGSTAINKDTGSGLAALTGGEIVAGNTVFFTYNSTSSVWVLSDALPLGTLAGANTEGVNFTISGGNLAFGSAPTLPSTTVATTQTATDSSTKVATTAQAASQPGSAKAYVDFTVSGSTCTIVSSFNVSSVTYSSTGRYVVNFTNALGGTNYAVVATSGSSSGSYVVNSGTKNTGSVAVATNAGGTTTPVDVPEMSVVVFR